MSCGHEQEARAYMLRKYQRAIFHDDEYGWQSAAGAMMAIYVIFNGQLGEDADFLGEICCCHFMRVAKEKRES